MKRFLSVYMIVAGLICFNGCGNPANAEGGFYEVTLEPLP